MLEWADDLRIVGTSLYLDSRQPRANCFVSHAHSDHIGLHEHAIATPATAALAEHRIGMTRVQMLDYRTDVTLAGGFGVARLLPAGHVYGSAMLHLTRPQGTLLYTGDFKLRPSLTVEQAQPMPAEHLVMESTYGQPHFRFPPWRDVAAQLCDIIEDALRSARQPIVMGYSLGKAQEITRILTDAGFPVTLHGAAHAMNEIHQRMGVKLGTYRRYAFQDFHGPDAIDLRCRGVLVAPPQVARTPFVTRFNNPVRLMMTGWALLKGAQYRYGVDYVLPLSDHADFDELLELVEIVQPKKVYTHHGYREFAEILKHRGIDACPACPDPQLSLFQ